MLDDKFKEPQFEGYQTDAAVTDPVPLETITGWWATTNGAPTWTPRTFREMVAIDPATSTVYFYHVETKTWVASGGAGGNYPTLLQDGGLLLSADTTGTLYTNTSGITLALRVGFSLVVESNGIGAGDAEVDIDWTDGNGNSEGFTSNTVNLALADDTTNITDGTGDVDGSLILLGDGEDLTYDLHSIGSWNGADVRFVYTVEQLTENGLA